MATQGTANYFMVRSVLKQDADFVTYAEKHELEHLVQECTKFFIRKPNLQPAQAFQEFIQSYLKGESILLRPFAQFSSSAVNRVVFVINFAKIFECFEEKNGFDYLQLVKLLCSDFPRDTIISSLQLFGELEEDLLMKKTYTLQQFSRALLFNFLFDSLLQGVKEQLKKSSSLEALVSLLKNYYPSNVESPYLPSQAAVYETLIKFSAERNKPVPFPILPYSSEMMSTTHLCNGSLTYAQFAQTLFKSQKIESQLSKLLSVFDKSNARVLEVQRMEAEEGRRSKK